MVTSANIADMIKAVRSDSKSPLIMERCRDASHRKEERGGNMVVLDPVNRNPFPFASLNLCVTWLQGSSASEYILGAW
jgi:hypothetical protein